MEEWERNQEVAGDQVWSHNMDSIKAAYQKEKWESEHKQKQEEIKAAMEAEAHAAE